MQVDRERVLKNLTVLPKRAQRITSKYENTNNCDILVTESNENK